MHPAQQLGFSSYGAHHDWNAQQRAFFGPSEGGRVHLHLSALAAIATGVPGLRFRAPITRVVAFRPVKYSSASWPLLGQIS